MPVKTKENKTSKAKGAASLSSKASAETISAPFDPRELKYDNLLRNLQGNILKGHGRDNTVHMLVWFDAGKTDDVKEWIADFAKDKVTSFKEQLRQREVYKRNGVSNGLFAGLYLTKNFYTDFGFDTSGLKNGKAFSDGLRMRKDLQDDYTKVESAYHQEGKDEDGNDRKPIHAMILLAHTDVIELNKAAHEICEELGNFKKAEPENPIAEVLTTEYGGAIRNANGDGLEHFGYVDGISQPLFLKEDIDEYKKNNLDPLDFNPLAPASLVLVNDPLALDDGACGSYFVFRKLEQNVRGFKKAEEDLGDRLGLTGEDKERAGAMIIGRFEDGTPVTLSEEDRMISSGIINNFRYDIEIDGKEDNAGARCPFHGHIRKTNPRRPEDLDHRMARRGITYGHRNVSTTVEQSFVQMPSDGVGLLFMSFQSNIEKQFEYIQTQANSENFPDHPKTGMDLIIGQGKASRDGLYATTWNDGTTRCPATFKNFVHFKGGEYFFAPSLSFLKNIKDVPTSKTVETPFA